MCQTRCCWLFCTWSVSFDAHHRSPREVLLFLSFYRQETWDIQKSSVLLETVQLTGGETKIWAYSNFRACALNYNANDGRWTVLSIARCSIWNSLVASLETSHTLKLSLVLMLVLLLTAYVISWFCFNSINPKGLPYKVKRDSTYIWGMFWWLTSMCVEHFICSICSISGSFCCNPF